MPYALFDPLAQAEDVPSTCYSKADTAAEPHTTSPSPTPTCFGVREAQERSDRALESNTCSLHWRNICL